MVGVVRVNKNCNRISTLARSARSGLKFRATTQKNLYFVTKRKNLDHTFFGKLYFQNFLSSQIVRLLQLNESCADLKIADFCAAPGGKTLGLLDRYPFCALSAFEVNKKRFSSLKKLLSEWGVNVNTQNIDSQFIFRKGQQFDAVLLDAPCSGVGTTKKTESKKKINFLAELQRRLMLSAFLSLKCDGVMLYCVCTNNPEETIKNIVRFAKKFDGRFESLDIRKNVEETVKLGAKYGVLVNVDESVLGSCYLSTLKESFFVWCIKKTNLQANKNN